MTSVPQSPIDPRANGAGDGLDTPSVESSAKSPAGAVAPSTALPSVPLWVRLTSLARGPIERRLTMWRPLVGIVAAYEPELMKLNDYELRKRSLSLQYRAKSGEPLTRIMPEAYALVREAARRSLNMRHFDTQILGGIALHHRCVAEMQTGEGKTLTATLPCYLHALTGKGVHLATVNDYLAKRDAEWMSPIYAKLGLSIGIIQTQQQTPQRRKAYAADITYGTAKEFGFDFLRDRLLLRRTREGQLDLMGGMLGLTGADGGEKPTQRESNFVLVDEADSILIDEARTPLIISALPTEEQKIEVECYRWAADVVSHFVEDEHYEYEHDERKVTLTSVGRQRVRTLPKPDAMDEVGLFTIYEYIERAIKVAKEFIRDRHFVVVEGEIVIVDEFTGRLAEGRKWSAGIHQAVEAMAGVAGQKVDITVATGQAARVTVQDFFLRYPTIAGMTGTAANSGPELKKIYNVQNVPIPTNRPPQRVRLPDRVFGTADEKWAAIVEEVQAMHALRRPLLIGTRSIDKSEHLSTLLRAVGIQPQVLNARYIEQEAQLVEQAGQLDRVTVSTNMAGRGTDIKLGPGVLELGGLHVICTEMHDSARIDRQLAGRCGRQGDPGSWRQYLALDDEILLMGFGPKKGKRLREQGERGGHFDHLARLFKRAQKKIERRHFRDRKVLMHYEKERTKMHREMGQDPYLDSAG